MGEEKFASLSSGLLARKGGAKPAMRRQNYINPQGDVSEDLGWNDMGDHDDFNGHDDAHASYGAPHEVCDSDVDGAPVPQIRMQIDALEVDFGSAEDDGDIRPVPSSGLTPVAAETVPSLFETAPEARFEVVEPQPAKPAPQKMLARDKIAFTLRLDKDRHLKLRLASAVSNRSAQQLVTEALDVFLENQPGLTDFARHSPRAASAR